MKPTVPEASRVTSEVADHFLRDYPDHPYWSESSWFSWGIPERGINGAFYIHFRVNMNCVLAGAFMWDASGEHSFDCLYWDWQAMRTLPEGRYGVDYDKGNWQTPWGMKHKMLEPMRRYKLDYERENFLLDLTFDAVAEGHQIPRKSDHGLQNAYAFHFEQPGRIRGTVDLDGERYEVDCFSIRDGSHGPRFLEVTTPGRQSGEAFDRSVRDITAFLQYAGEPAALKRESVGVWVLLYLALFTLIAWFLNREFWKDVH